MKEGELGRVYSDGEIIFKEGETGHVMYVIQSGKVKITKKNTLRRHPARNSRKWRNLRRDGII